MQIVRRVANLIDSLVGFGIDSTGAVVAQPKIIEIPMQSVGEREADAIRRKDGFGHLLEVGRGDNYFVVTRTRAFLCRHCLAPSLSR